MWGLPEAPLYERQSDQFLQPSVAGLLEFDHDFPADNAVHVALFGRLDQVDKERSKVDAREAWWLYAGEHVEVKIGFLKEFWGKLERENIVDIVNQRDIVEDFKGDEKLGQPGAKLAVPFEFGRAEILVLPYFRERTFPGRKGRFQFALPVTDEASYEAAREEWHVDAAARLQFFVDQFDFAVSHFYGTSRDPRFVPVLDAFGRPEALMPRYDLIHQTAIEFQAVQFGTVWKLEAFRRDPERSDAPGGDSYGVGVGLEHELVRLFDTPASLTLYGEYYYDGRNPRETPNVLDNDIYLGARLALNDFDGTVLELQWSFDYRSLGSLLTLEGSTRLSESWVLSGEFDVFLNAEDDPLLQSFRQDTRLLLRLRRFF